MLPKVYRTLLALTLISLTACASPAAPVAEQPTTSPSPSAASSPSTSASPSPSVAAPTLIPATPSPSTATSADPSPSAAASAAPSAEPSASATPDLGEVAILELGGQLRLQRGTQQQSLADLEGDDWSGTDLVWSPDGWRLVTADGVRTFGAEGAPPVLSPLVGAKYRWSPDSRYLAWTLMIEEHTDALIVAGPDGDQPRNTDGSHWGSVGLPDWTPDSTLVIAGNLAATVDGSEPPALPEERAPDAAWSPDGNTLAWTRIDNDGVMITRTLTLWDGAATREIGGLAVTRTEANSQIDWAEPGFDPTRLFWLPDSSGVLLPIPTDGLRGGGTWRILLDGTVEQISPATITDLAADGQRMLARTAEDQIVVVALADGTIEGELGPGVAAVWRPTPTGSPPSAPLAEKSPTLSLTTPRMQGEAVRDLQQRLLAQAYDSGEADGIFGPQTEQAVREFQEQQGISVDGIVGPRTWSLLRAMEWSPRPIE